MNSYENFGPLTATTGEAVEAYRRVKFSGGVLVYADAGEAHNGVTKYAAASGELVSYWPTNWPGVIPMTAAGAITAFADIYGAADGKIDDAAVGTKLGIAMQAATADGDMIPAMAAGTMVASDLQSAIATKVHYVEDFFTGVTEDGGAFSETADKADWLLTVIDGQPDEGEVCNVADDAAGGILTITTNDAANDSCELQLNGEPFALAVGKPLRWGCKLAINDVDKADWFVGLAITDTAILAGGVTDRVGFECLHDGNIDALVEQDGTENIADTLVNIADGSLATFDAKAVVLEFVWDGVDTITFIVDGVLTNTMTDNGTTIVIPDDEAMTPSICLETSAAQVVTAWVDFVEVIADRV